MFAFIDDTRRIFRDFTYLLFRALLVLYEGSYSSLFLNKVAGLRSATLLKRRLCHRCFPVNFAKILRTPFLQDTFGLLLLQKLGIEKVKRVANIENHIFIKYLQLNYSSRWIEDNKKKDQTIADVLLHLKNEICYK